jgi:hypothetical protein
VTTASRLLALAEKATARPWHTRDTDALISGGPEETYVVEGQGSHRNQGVRADLSLIVTLVNALPEIVAVLEQHGPSQYSECPVCILGTALAAALDKAGQP